MTFSSLLPKHTLCLFLFLLTFSHSKLVVKSPDDLKNQFDAVNGIDYTVLTPQNKITYKRAFIGSLKLPDQTDACEPLDSLSGLNDNEVLFNPVLLTTWGGCHYAQKVKNAEMAGAKMVILILRHDMEANHATVRSLPIETNVEVLAISKADGDKIVEYIQQKKTNRGDPAVELNYSYDIEKHLNYQGSKVVLDFWFSSADKAAYDFLETLKSVLENFGTSVEFNPRYVLWQFDESNKIDDPRCVSNGLYCDPEALPEGRLRGKEAVWEDLRQICYRELDGKTTLNNGWWQYVTAFGQNCITQSADEIPECRNSITQNFQKLSREAEDCLNREKANTIIDYLRNEVDDREKNAVEHYPSFYVNKERYTGSFRNKYLIKEFVCSHFLQDEIPSTCVEPVTTTQTTASTSSDTALYVFIVLGSVLIMAVMLYCVRRTVKRQVMGRMNEEISHIVTQYKQFKDKSNSFSGDEEM